MTHDEMLALIPESVRYDHVPIPDENNALFYWSEAQEILADFDLERCLAILGLLGPSSEKDQAPAEPLSSQDYLWLESFTEQSQRVFELLRAGVRSGHIQVPELEMEEGSIQEHARSMVPFYRLSLAWLALARLRLAERRYDDVARELLTLGQMGHLLCTGECHVIHYLAGITVQEQALSCLRGLLTELDRNHPIRLRVASACHDWLADDQGAILSQQVDLCAHALPEVERLAKCRDLAALVDELLERHYSHESLRDDDSSDEPSGDDGRAQWRREGILFLLDDHPQPFDARATVEQLGSTVQDRIDAMRADQKPSAGVLPWWKKIKRVYRQSQRRVRLDRWPMQFRSGWPFQFLGPSETAKERLASVKSNFPARTWLKVQPPTEDQLRSARERLQRLPNAFGILAADAVLSADVVPKLEKDRRQGLKTTLLHCKFAEERAPASSS